MAPAGFLRIPSLRGVCRKYEARRGMEVALAPLEVLVEMGLLENRHIDGAKDAVEVLNRVLMEMLEPIRGTAAKDSFAIHVELIAGFEGDSFLEINWSVSDMAYVPLAEVARRLEGNPLQDRLVATFYKSLYQAADAVMKPYSLEDAADQYRWHLEYVEKCKEESGYEDGDVSEEANPGICPTYVHQASKLKLPKCAIKTAVAAISDPACRKVFEDCLAAEKLAGEIKFPAMPPLLKTSLQSRLDYHGNSQIGIGIGIDRNDGITAWMDTYMEDLFQGGEDPYPSLAHAYYVSDNAGLRGLFEMLPRMVKVTALLNQCVETIEEWEKCNSK